MAPVPIHHEEHEGHIGQVGGAVYADQIGHPFILRVLRAFVVNTDTISP